MATRVRVDGKPFSSLAADVLGFEPGVDTLAEFRAIMDHNDVDIMFNKGLKKLFYFDAHDTSVDDGATIIRPDDIPIGSPGRWLEIPVGGAAAPTIQQVEEEFTPTAGQISFSTTWTPTTPVSVDFVVNGVDYEQGVDFTVSGKNVTWLNVPFVMEADDHVTIRYWR